MIYYIKYNSLKLLIVDRMFLFYEVKLQLYRIKKIILRQLNLSLLLLFINNKEILKLLL